MIAMAIIPIKYSKLFSKETKYIVKLSNCFSFSNAHDSKDDIKLGNEIDLFHSITGAFRIIKKTVVKITIITGNNFTFL